MVLGQAAAGGRPVSRPLSRSGGSRCITSHQAAGVSQPSAMQPWSRACRARHSPAGTVRTSSPASSGTPAGSMSSRATPASESSRRISAKGRGPSQVVSTTPAVARSPCTAVCSPCSAATRVWLACARSGSSRSLRVSASRRARSVRRAASPEASRQRRASSWRAACSITPSWPAIAASSSSATPPEPGHTSRATYPRAHTAVSARRCRGPPQSLLT